MSRTALDEINDFLSECDAVDGFDFDLVGFDCAAEIERDEPWICPFKPGCGKAVKDCPLRAQMLRVSRAPRRVQ